MESQTEPCAARLTISLPGKQRELQLWLVDQLTILAEALGESVTPQRLQIYATDLSLDLSQEQLRLALTRARQECRFYPKIAELREFAGASAEDRGEVEGEAAWNWTNDYLRTWGVERLPIYFRGKRLEAPPLPARIEYALRRIGGLRGLNQITEESRPFKFRAFCEAYRQAPVAELMQPELVGMFGAENLLGNIKQLSEAVASNQERPPATEKHHKPPLKAIPTPLTDAQCRDRRQLLRQQAALLANSATFKGERSDSHGNL